MLNGRRGDNDVTKSAGNFYCAVGCTPVLAGRPVAIDEASE